MGRKKNSEAIVQFVILICITLLLIYAMLSGKVTYYVHPRFYLGIWASIIILILFALSLIPKIEKARHNVNIRQYIIFAIPLVASLLFPATGVGGKNMTMAEGNFSSSAYQCQSDENLDNGEEQRPNADTYATEDMTVNYDYTDYSDDLQENTYDTTNAQVDAFEKYSQYEVDGVVVIGDDIFSDWYDDVYDNLEDFVGKKFEYLAQVYSMDDFEANQFLAGRYFMVCCAADLVGYGIVCESDKRSELKDEDWITVTGTVKEYQYNGYAVPILTDVNIEPAESPEVEYIYYNGY